MGCRRRTQPSCLGSAPSAQITACWGRWQTQRSVGRLGLFLHPSGAMRAACRALPRLPRLPAAVKSPGTASACAEAVALPTSATAARGAAFSAAAGRGAGPGWLGAKFRWAGMAAGLGLGAAGAAQLYSSGGSRGPAECEAGPGAGSSERHGLWCSARAGEPSASSSSWTLQATDVSDGCRAITARCEAGMRVQIAC